VYARFVVNLRSGGGLLLYHKFTTFTVVVNVNNTRRGIYAVRYGRFWSPRKIGGYDFSIPLRIGVENRGRFGNVDVLSVPRRSISIVTHDAEATQRETVILHF